MLERNLKHKKEQKKLTAIREGKQREQKKRIMGAKHRAAPKR